MTLDRIVISDVKVTQKSNGHPVVLTAKSGSLYEGDGTSAPMIFIPDQNATPDHGGPSTAYRYKISYIVAGERESLRNLAYQGHAEGFGCYIFHN